MKKTALTLVALGTMLFAASAFGEATVAVTDPTPNNTFSGSYDTGNPQSPDEDQEGYVGVYLEEEEGTGAVACNGNPGTLANPENDGQGYVWVSPDGSLASDGSRMASAPGGVAGAGGAHQTTETDAEGNETTTPTGSSPCPEQSPDSVNE